MFKILKSKTGYTLIELLIVICILGILAVISIPAVTGLIDRSRRTADTYTASEMTNAISQFTSEYELYTTDIASNEVDLNDLSASQARVYNSTFISKREDVANFESNGIYGDGVDCSTKYPATPSTAISVIKNYLKSTSSLFEPKQSFYSYWYSPEMGIVVCAPAKSTGLELDSLALKEKNSLSRNDISLSDSAVSTSKYQWIDITVFASSYDWMCVASDTPYFEIQLETDCNSFFQSINKLYVVYNHSTDNMRIKNNAENTMINIKTMSDKQMLDTASDVLNKSLTKAQHNGKMIVALINENTGEKKEYGFKCYNGEKIDIYTAQQNIDTDTEGGTTPTTPTTTPSSGTNPSTQTTTPEKQIVGKDYSGYGVDSDKEVLIVIQVYESLSSKMVKIKVNGTTVDGFNDPSYFTSQSVMENQIKTIIGNILTEKDIAMENAKIARYDEVSGTEILNVHGEDAKLTEEQQKQLDELLASLN